jgi:hypothetical protein
MIVVHLPYISNGYKTKLMHDAPPCRSKFCGTPRKRCSRDPRPRNCPVVV